jgi:UDP-galactopyranose mutase
VADVHNVKAAEIIAEIKGLPPEGYAEVFAFMLKTERDDPALQVALNRKQNSTTGQVVSRPYEQAKASVRAALNPAR